MKGMQMNTDPFKEYLIEKDPTQKEKSYAWDTAIGLQAVDGLRPSGYLKEIAAKNIKGKITLEEAYQQIESYYQEKPYHNETERTKEADKVSVRIVSLLTEKAFSFNPKEYVAIHRKLFTGIYPHAGQLRNYNITKKEWVLDGDSVIYGSATELEATLDYDFAQERTFSYRNLPTNAMIKHLAEFIARLWQIHIFCEGNTRTIAVFFIKYLHTLGFVVTNNIFAENAWYFRNAMVRANYNNYKKGVFATTEYLETFLRNLLLEETNPLKNRDLHIQDKGN